MTVIITLLACLCLFALFLSWCAIRAAAATSRQVAELRAGMQLMSMATDKLNSLGERLKNILEFTQQ